LFGQLKDANDAIFTATRDARDSIPTACVVCYPRVEGESSSEKDLEDHVYIPTANKTRRKKQTHSSLANNYQLGGAFRVEFSRSVIAVLRPLVSFVCSR
jgi:hypothetical protein